jgi:hypothetical protein
MVVDCLALTDRIVMALVVTACVCGALTFIRFVLFKDGR